MTDTKAPEAVGSAGEVEIPAGMKPWHGGIEQPVDWPRFAALAYRNGEISKGGTDYDWRHLGLPYDIIAYTPKPLTSGSSRPAISDSGGEVYDKALRSAHLASVEFAHPLAAPTTEARHTDDAEARAREVLRQTRQRFASKVGMLLRQFGLNDEAVPIDTAIRAMLAFASPRPTAQDDAVRVMRNALQDIAEAEAIPNDAVAFVWCRDVASAALRQSTIKQEGE